jgi:hypothetical protein
LWVHLASITYYSINSSSTSSSMRSIFSSPPLLQTVQPTACLAAELLLWPGVDGLPCWATPVRVSIELSRALRLEDSSLQAAVDYAAASSSTSSSSRGGMIHRP